MTLFLRPQGLSGKPLDLLLLRSSEANALKGAPHLIRLLGLAHDCRSVRRDLFVLHRALGLDDGSKNSLEHTARWRDPNTGLIPYCGMALPSTVLGRPLGRVCPACLAEGKDFRWAWDIKTVIACELHGCFLRDRCPSCGLPLTWNRPRLDECRCGSSYLRDMDPAPRSAVALSAALVGCGTCENATLRLSDVAQLLWFAAVRHQGSVRRGATIECPDVPTTWALVAPVAGILDDWPRGFAELIRASHRADAQSSSLYRHLPILADLKHSFRTRSPKILQAASETINADPALPTIRSNSSFHRPDAVSIGAAAAARILGISPQTVCNRIAAGEMPGRIITVGRRRMAAIQRNHAISCANATQSTSVSSVAAELGVSQKHIERLCDAGQLRRGPKLAESAQALLRTLDNIASQGVALPGDTVSLAGVPSLRGPTQPVAVALVLTGILSAWYGRDSETPPLQRILVSRSELSRLAAGGLSVREAAKMLGVAVRQIPVLVARGCLPICNQRKRRCIALEAAHHFMERYITAGRLASHAHTNTRTTLARLRDAGAVPVINSDIRKGISSVWRLSDVELVLRGSAPL